MSANEPKVGINTGVTLAGIIVAVALSYGATQSAAEDAQQTANAAVQRVAAVEQDIATIANDVSVNATQISAQSKGINWIGAAVEKLAAQAPGIALPTRPIVPEN